MWETAVFLTYRRWREKLLLGLLVFWLCTPEGGDCLCVQYVLMIGDRSLLHAYIAIAKVPATINNLFQNSLQENRAVVNLSLLQ